MNESAAEAPLGDGADDSDKNVEVASKQFMGIAICCIYARGSKIEEHVNFQLGKPRGEGCTVKTFCLKHIDFGKVTDARDAGGSATN
jgi:hypothetical protein